MELVYITHGSLAHAHFLAPLISWLIVIGAVYGLIRLIVDVVRLVRSASTKNMGALAHDYRAGDVPTHQK